MKNIKQLIFPPDKIKVYVYMISNVFAMGMSFIINYLLTLWVPANEYGHYKFATSFLLTLPSFIEFGIHFSCARIVAKNYSDAKHPVVSLSVVIVTIIGIATSVILYMLCYLNKYFNFTLLTTLNEIKVIFPFVFVILIKTIIVHLYQGTGEIYKLSVMNIMQYLLLLIMFTITRLLNIEFTITKLVYFFVISNTVLYVTQLFKLNYDFSEYKNNIAILFQDIKNNGVKIYFSSIITTLTSNVISLICGSLYGFAEYGYYSLALSLSQFFTFIASSMTVVKFKENVQKMKLYKNDIIFMVSLYGLIYIVFLLLIDKVFFLFFTEEYAPTLGYFKGLAFAYIINGFVLYFNRFFIAVGLGKIIMRNSFIIGILNIVLSCIFVPIMELKGVVYTSIISMLINLSMFLVAYIKYEKGIKKHEVNHST